MSGPNLPEELVLKIDDTVIPLEIDCPACGGTGNVSVPQAAPTVNYSSSVNVVISNPCKRCHTIGKIPSENGRMILKLYSKFGRLGKRI